MKLSPELEDRARKVRLILMDVDGIMTAGTLPFFGDGTEMKVFHAQDGVGIRLAQRAGLEIGVISGRQSRAVEVRCRELDIAEVHLGEWKKLPIFEEILERRGFAPEQVSFLGDDLVDLPILRRAGLAITVPEARPEVLEAAHAVTELPGGRGAVRDALEAIIKIQGRWDEILTLYP